MSLFIAHFDRVRDYTLQFTITHTYISVHSHASLPLPGGGFQRRIFPFLWVPELFPCLSYQLLTTTTHKDWTQRFSDCNCWLVMVITAYKRTLLSLPSNGSACHYTYIIVRAHTPYSRLVFLDEVCLEGHRYWPPVYFERILDLRGVSLWPDNGFPISAAYRSL
jgi:hypothetical protein